LNIQFDSRYIFGDLVWYYKGCVANDVSLLRSYRTKNNNYKILTMCRSYGAIKQQTTTTKF
jgi:hypothetical protein